MIGENVGLSAVGNDCGEGQDRDRAEESSRDSIPRVHF